MPIYEQSYRRHEARGALRQVRFWPITREALRLILSRKAFIVLWGLGWIPFVVRAIQIWIVTRFPEANRMVPVDGRLFGEYLNQQITFLLLLTIFGGAGLIANDLRTGAILVYLSRPLTRRDYVLGKLGVVLGLNLSATLVPGLLLYGVGVLIAPNLLLKWSLAWIGPAVVLHSLVLSFTMSLVGLAISSLSKSARVAGLGMFILMTMLSLALLIRQIADLPAVGLISLWGDLEEVGKALFGIPRDVLPWFYPALVLTAVGLGCLAVLRARVRAVEVVK